MAHRKTMTTTVTESKGVLVPVCEATQRLVLTEKQEMLMPYVLRGLTTDEISQETGLNPRTISSRFNAMFQANRLHGSNKIAWCWLNEGYALVPKLDPATTRFKSKNTYLIDTPAGMVAAKKSGTIWRDTTSMARIPNDQIKSIHELGTYDSD